MKKIIFKTISITLILTHLFVICFRDVSFAKEPAKAPTPTTPQQSPAPEPPVTPKTPSSPKTAPSQTMSITGSGSGGGLASLGFNLSSLRYFQNDPFTGRANFSLPIIVPPGRKGIQPNLSLTYASGGPNGILGVGWGLELGHIERSTKRGAPKYDSTDTFVFVSGGASQELVNIGGNEYRAKIEGGFSKFIHNGTDWLIIDKSGTKYYFGSTESSRQQKDSTRIFAWYLDKVKDVQANYMLISYQSDQNQIYPLKVEYTGNENLAQLPKYSVDFILEDRQDIFTNFRSGTKTTTAKRLKQIEVKFNQELVRKYVLDYLYSNSKRSLLTTITQYGQDGITSLPPIRFVYQEKKSNFAPIISWEGVYAYANDADWGTIRMMNGGHTYVDIFDINGDGLPDRVMRSYEAPWDHWNVQLNNGHGFDAPIRWEGVDDGGYGADWGTIRMMNSGHYYVDIFDINGDGLPDRVLRAYTAPWDHWNVQLNSDYLPDLLSQVDNGIGGSISLTYTPSTHFDNTGSDDLPDLPFPVYTVSSISSSDGQGNSYTTTYEYKDGLYDWQDREFRGFGYVKAVDAEGNYTESYFKQDDIYKARLYKQEAKDKNGNLYTRTENTWQSNQPYSGVYFPYLAQTDNYTYDGDATYKQTRLKFEYDSYGNPTKVISEGDVANTGDEKTQITEYTYNTTDWLLTFPKHTYLQDANQSKISEKWFYYDNHTNINDPPTQGLLTKEESWLYNPLTSQEQRVSAQYAYDQYGNLISATDALGRTSLTRYDSICFTYPILVINALGHIVRTVYYGINESPDDPFTGSGLVGQIKYTQDPNNQTTTNVYDPLGRLIKVIGPNDTESYPAVTYEYDLTTNPIKITKKVKADYASPPNYLTTYQFSDGLGRLIQSKSPAENEPSTGQARQVISDIVKFDSRGQVKEKYLPYFVNTSSNYVTPTYETPHATFSYDPLGRLIQTTRPDLTYSKVNYSDWVITTNDENGHQRKAYSDAYGRVTKIEEHNSTQIYTTAYQYDTLGNLTKVIDNQGNATQIWYDSLGRKLKMDDPDMGIWSYEYDKVGNLIKQTDAKGQTLEFEYDELNRLKRKTQSAQALAQYQYDDTFKNFCIGRLSKVTDSSGSTEFFYDNLGRETKSVKVVEATSYTVERTYDALDRLVSLKYPDGEVLNYTYNPQGITSITSSTGQTYVSNLDYSPTGQITKIVYGNGTETNYTYDPKTLRLNNLVSSSPSGKLQDLTYQFDNVGNIKNITDYVNTATQALLYDDLDRLIQASGSYGVFSYAYDSIGNMTYKEGINLTYGKAGKLPHAVTQYGSTIIDYDLNGNLLKKGNSELTYDVENRLTKVEDKSISQPVTLNISLSPGWNFISFPVVFTDAKISSVLASISGKYDQVSRYNSTTKTFEHYVGNTKYNQFDTFEYGKGYQIYITDPNGCTLTVTGTLPQSADIPLKSGYNLIFCPKTQETAVESALSPLKLGVDYSKVLYYNKATAKFQEYSSAKKEFATLKPGESYYLDCLKDTTWNITNSLPTTTFTYDGDGGRVKKTTASDSTTYIGSLFEKDSSSKATKHIFLGANRVAAVESTGNKYFYHSDHLGSSNVVTDGTGNQVGLTEFTPYGSTWKQTGSYNPKHKFTGKELDSTGLYFYGARYYDPQLGRFISADTIVQAPYDPQSLNRYSYCRNNPINYIDPTGNWWFIPFIIAAIKGAIVGALIGGAIAAITGGNIGQGFLTGAISGAIFGGVGSFGLKGLAHTVGHALAGAASGAATGAVTGGDIGMNALIGGLSAGASERLGSFGPLKDIAGRGFGTYINNLIRRTFIGSVVGGATSAAMGGSFGYGAIQGAKTSAIAYTANEALHELVEQAIEALTNQIEVKPTRQVDLTKETPISKAVKEAIVAKGPGSLLRSAGRVYSNLLGMKGAGLTLDVAGESLSGGGPFEKITSGAGSFAGFYVGSHIGAIEGPLGAAVFGIAGAEFLGDKFAVYGREADRFWGTAPNELANDQ